MVSAKSLFITGVALLATAASAAATAAKSHSIRDYDKPCGTDLPTAGIKKPVDGATITYTSEEQEYSEGATFEIIYCSGEYFKTSSLNVTALLGTLDGGIVLGSAEPSDSADLGGIYSYIFNVTVYPAYGYLTGPQKLSIFEVKTGYYDAYNYEVHTINIDLEIAPTEYTS